MKTIMIPVFCLALLLNSKAQNSVIMPQAATSPDTSGGNTKTSLSGTFSKKPVYHVSVGMDFWNSSGYGSAFTQYVVPTVSFPLGRKFMLSGGIAVLNTNYFNARPLYTGELYSPFNGNYTSVTMFASGTWFVNDRLTLSGSFFKEIPLTGKEMAYSPYSPVPCRGFQGMNLNFQYRIGQNGFIRFGFQYNQGQPGYYNPYSPGFLRGFGNIGMQGVPQSFYNIFTGN